MNSNSTFVLVLENHPMMREALRTAIEEEPDLAVAELGTNDSSTLQMVIPIQPDVLLLTFKPDIILLSLGNPGANELETLSILRKSLPGIPILALISNEVPGQEQTALRSGAQAVLTKAASRATLLQTLRELRTQTAPRYPAKTLGRMKTKH
jgi:DNA-binding NarL/FixJ family response regulator